MIKVIKEEIDEKFPLCSAIFGKKLLFFTKKCHFYIGFIVDFSSIFIEILSCPSESAAAAFVFEEKNSHVPE